MKEELDNLDDELFEIRTRRMLNQKEYDYGFPNAATRIRAAWMETWCQQSIQQGGSNA